MGSDTIDSVKPRLLVLTSTYPRWVDDHEPGFVHELSRRLTQRFDVTVIGPHAAGAKREEVMDGVRVLRYRYAPAALETLVNDGGIVTNLRRSVWKYLLVPGFLLGQVWLLWRLLQRWKPDVVHAHWLLPQGLMIAMSGGRVPFVVTSHGVDLFALKAKPFTALKRLVVRRAAAITVVSTAMRDALAGLDAPPDKVTVLPMGVDLTASFTPDQSVSRTPHELLFVGRLVEKKGLNHLIDAMPAIIDRCPQAHLTVAGFGPEASALKARAQQLGLSEKLRFTGAVAQTDLPAMYRRAAVFVAPFVQTASGDQEGLPVALMEAIACGCPVVVGDVSGVHDLLDEADTNVMVDPVDTAALAAAVVRVLNDPQNAGATSDERRNRLNSMIDWTVIADRYARLLTACLRSRNIKGQNG